MSYSIAIWDPSRHGPAPQTFDEVVAQYRKLSEVDDEPNYWFVSFAQRIQDMVKFTDAPNEEWQRLYGQFVASAKRSRGALFQVDMPRDNPAGMLKRMVQTATALKLVVYDDNSGLAFLPDGQVLPPAKARVWQAIQSGRDYNPDALPDTKPAFLELAQPLFAQVFGPHGFVEGVNNHGEPVLTRQCAGGDQYLQISSKPLRGKPGFGVDIDFNMTSPAVNDIYQQFQFPRGAPSPYALGSSLFLIGSRNSADLEVQTRKDLEALFHAAAQRIMPILDTARDIRGMDRAMNGEAAVKLRDYLRRTIYIPHCLIVAWLAGNPHFEDLLIELTEAARKFWPAAQTDSQLRWNELARLADYLRHEVQPLP